MATARATTESLTHLVLCGGAGSRLGGRDKPLADWCGKPLIEHVLDAGPANIPRMISANRNFEAYAKYGKVFSDADVGLGMDGPLVGIYGGLTRARTPWILVTPGDTPRLEHDWWEALLALSDNHSAVVAHDGERQQHLHLLLHRQVIGTLEAFLRTGRVEVYKFLEALAPAQAPFADAAQFANFNEPRDFELG